MRFQQYLVLALGLFVVTWLATYSEVALASCKGNNSLLEERYAAADAIVVAQVNSCADSNLPINGQCPDYIYQFAVLEVLKDSTPSRDHSGTFQGNDPMGCGQAFLVGQPYLLFLDEKGFPLRYLSGPLSGDRWTVSTAKESVEILRQFRDGEIGDLSGAWRFSDSGLTSKLEHFLSEASIGIQYDYSDYYNIPLMPIEGSGSQGEALFEVYGPTSENYKFAGAIESEFAGPKNGSHSVTVSVALQGRKSASEQAVTISVGTQSWILDAKTVRMQGSQILDPAVTVTDLVGGTAATEILEAMMVPTDVVISVVEMSSIGEFAKQDAAVAPSITLRTRSTQLAATRNRFDTCLRGEIRRGAIVIH